MTKNKTKQAELWLHGKQGNELHSYMEQASSANDALMGYAESLRAASERLEDLADYIDKLDDPESIIIDGDENFIWIEGPADIIQDMISKQLIEKGPELEDEDENDE